MPKSLLTPKTLSPVSAGRLTIGFIGQGWIGKNYANNFEARGYQTVRYALEEPYAQNKEKIKECDIVFIAVPTPTTPEGFNASAVRNTLSFVGEGKTAVIKSTLAPGTTQALQKEFPKIKVLHSPEFLSRGTAVQDAAHPHQNIIGIPEDSPAYHAAAELVLAVLPPAPSIMVSSHTSEFFKYVHNTTLFVKSVHMNLLYDVAQALAVKWEDIQELIKHDPMLASRIENVSHWHITPVHKGGRGIGGDCHIKDFETFSRFYKEHVDDAMGAAAIDAFKHKNIELLSTSGKDLGLLKGVYGPALRAPATPAPLGYRLLPPMRSVEKVLVGAGSTVIALGIISIVIQLADVILG